MEEFLKLESKQTNHSEKSILGKIALGVTGTITAGVVAFTLPFVTPALRKACLPYVPASEAQVKHVLRAVRLLKSRNVVDLGSGDGRIVRAIALHCPSVRSCKGVELNPWLVLYSKLHYYFYAHTTAVRVKYWRKNLWKFSLHNFDTVVVFGVESMMKDLGNKCKNEMKIGSSIVACRFPLIGWEATETVGSGIDTVWIYQV